MISTWMLHAALVAALLGLSAHALERALLAIGRPTRWAWAGALAGSLLLPALRLLLPGASPAGGTRVGVGAAEVLSVLPGASGAGATRLLEPALTIALPLSSAAMLAVLAASLLRVRRERRRWTPEAVQGEPVLVSEDRGPAVTGFLRPAIVLPRWALACGEDEQRLLLAHEREHLRAGDPRLLLAALVAVALAPWNLALWWQLRRLRLAVEVDCDARVLRRIPRPRAYGLLLLEVGRRASGLPLPAAAFGEPRSFLERRVRRLTESRRPGRAARLGLALAAVAGIALACEVPEPARPRIDAVLPSAAPAVRDEGGSPEPTPYTEKPVLLNREEFGRALEGAYPPLLREADIGGTVLVWVRIGADGTVEESRVSGGSGHPALDEAARRTLLLARFTPARDERAAVPVWIQLPVTFATR